MLNTDINQFVIVKSAGSDFESLLGLPQEKVRVGDEVTGSLLEEVKVSIFEGKSKDLPSLAEGVL